MTASLARGSEGATCTEGPVSIRRVVVAIRILAAHERSLATKTTKGR